MKRAEKKRHLLVGKLKERHRRHRPGSAHWELTVSRGSGRHPGKGMFEGGFGRQKKILPLGKGEQGHSGMKEEYDIFGD